ncbi:hypothetical protein ES332_A11G124100v1 [Gossypium tomentosum]|uniref:SMP-30/Gluconolactonase/LRE-like region domain-containing protein n=1 Tax=Gossypium tomentosum TaxID=34277 RepID=A0A5D2N8J7_GOSTO|nr:hypothetical protein ES332_A11G124100v1 [Gossypium tomentosum]
MALWFCSARLFIFLFILSALPIAYIIYQERAETDHHVFHYYSSGFFRESAKWDYESRRFLVTFLEGGVGEIHVPQNYTCDIVLKEVTVVKDSDLTGNASLGLALDNPRNRLLVAVADMFGNRYSALAAYDLSTWKRLFLTKLSGSGAEKSLADDVAVDADGNAYVTDVKGSKLWKVGVDGEILSTLTNPLFTPKEWYKSLAVLSGIVYLPDGYLIVIHTLGGYLLKIDLAKGHEVKLIELAGGPLSFGDGLELILLFQ